MSETRSLAEAIREAVRRDHRTPYALAKEAGFDKSMLHRFMRGERNLGLDPAGKLCQVLGLELRQVQKKRGR